MMLRSMPDCILSVIGDENDRITARTIAGAGDDVIIVDTTSGFDDFLGSDKPKQQSCAHARPTLALPPKPILQPASVHPDAPQPQPQPPRAEQAPPPAMQQRKAAERRVARETEVSCLRSS